VARIGESGDLVKCSSCGKTQIRRPVADPRVYVCDECTIKGDTQSWQERALCAQTDPEAFFPEKGGSPREAKRICTGCEVRVECLEYALANDERFGVWGGLSERERRRMRRRGA
jgi:WhiB family transcriptional regulator, redox-sensing transcriptional regulator